MMEIDEVEYRKNRRSSEEEIHYSCPRCNAELVTLFQDMQSEDKCPECSVRFIFSEESKLLIENERRDALLAEEKEQVRSAERMQQRSQKNEELLRLLKSSRKTFLIVVACLVGILVWCGAIFTAYTFRKEISEVMFAGTQSVADSIPSLPSMPSLPTNPVRDLFAKKTVEIGLGTATIYDYGENELNSLHLDCNNGLVIEINWKRNVFSEFGYDVDEPVVNKSYNRLAVMMAAKGVIASYLRGEYD